MKSVLVYVAVVLAAVSVAQPSSTSMVSLTASYLQIGAGVSDLAVNADGRFYAFSSADPNIIAGDTNGVPDIFVRDIQTGILRRVSVASGGAQANGPSHSPSVSSGGRYVAFVSAATNLVEADTNGVEDIFLHDVETGVTISVSVSNAGIQANGPSSEPFVNGTGRLIAFTSHATNLAVDDSNGVSDVFVHDRNLMVTECASRANMSNAIGNGPSASPSMDATGELVCFTSEASNLVPADTNEVSDVFLRWNGNTGRVSRSPALLEGNGPSYHASVSPDGTYIAYASEATNLFAGDKNGVADLFLFDMVVFGTEHIRVSPVGVQPNGHSWSPRLSYGGRHIAFLSDATNLVEDDTNSLTDAFVIDRQTQQTILASRSSMGVIADGVSRAVSITGNGRVAFISEAANLYPLDNNSAPDAFCHDIFTVRASEIDILRGVTLSGDLQSTVYADDESSLTLAPGITFSTLQAPIAVIADSNVLRTQPIALSASVRSSSSSANVRQTIEWYDYTVNQYVIVDVRNLSTGFTEVTVSRGYQEAAKFISPMGNVSMRISLRAVGPTFVYPWQTRIDQISWRVYE